MLMATPARRRPRLGRWLAGAAALFVLLGAGAAAGAWNAGYRGYLVHTGSMSPTIPSGDLVVARTGASYAVGDVITFEHGDGPGDLVTHRITRITAAGITTKGDANRTADVWTIAPSQVHGVAMTHVPNGGYVAYFLQQRAGIGALMTTVLTVILLWGLFFPPTTKPTPRVAAWRGSFVPVKIPVKLPVNTPARTAVRQPVGAGAPGDPASWPAG